MRFPRRSGILLHPTSLPGRFGIGDLGDAAYRFVDFLAASGQSYWQVLPLSPTGYADSPYQTLSAFAGNPMLISPERLVETGHLSAADLADVPAFPDDWLAVKRYANERGIRIIGDIPIFVSMDSADVWANPHLFHFDAALRPTIVSGVPPDYFSATGQLWGHPLYRWEVMAQENYAWWIARFRMAFTQADVVRIDHFRGFYNYWEVPADAETAVVGRWVYGPGADFFHAVTAALGEVAIIAEDLGDFDAASRAGVDALQAEFRYPGMKVLQFAFGTGPGDPFLPHNFTREWFVYAGTHDNDTTVGWYQVSATEAERDYARKYLGSDGYLPESCTGVSTGLGAFWPHS